MIKPAALKMHSAVFPYFNVLTPCTCKNIIPQIAYNENHRKTKNRIAPVSLTLFIFAFFRHLIDDLMHFIELSADHTCRIKQKSDAEIHGNMLQIIRNNERHVFRYDQIIRIDQRSNIAVTAKDLKSGNT